MRRICGALACVAAAVSSAPVFGAEQAQRAGDFSALGKSYLYQFLAMSPMEAIPGPAELRIERKAGATITVETAPIERLRSILQDCRKAAFGYSYRAADAPGRVEIHQSFECLRAGADDKSANVTVASSPDGSSIERVTVLLGGPISWPSPPPVMAPPGYGLDEYKRNKEIANAFFAALARDGGTNLPPIERPVVRYGDRINPTVEVPLDRAREILAGCERFSQQPIDAEIDGRSRRGLIIDWKCDKRSSAYVDVVAFVSVNKDSVDFIGISPTLGYIVPPPGGHP